MPCKLAAIDSLCLLSAAKAMRAHIAKGSQVTDEMRSTVRSRPAWCMLYCECCMAAAVLAAPG